MMYGRAMLGRRCLMVTSDDYGYSSERDDGILDCYHAGAITGAVLMVNGVSAMSGVAKAQQAGIPLDLHLNITEGTPVGRGPYTTLVDNEGFMLGKLGIKEAQATGKLDLEEVRAEIQAQIDKFEELTGHKPVKVDGHHHSHIIPGVVDVYSDVLCRNGIKLTRLPVETEVESHCFVSEVQGKFLREMVKQSIDARVVFDKNRLGYPGGFAGLRTMSTEMTVSSLQTSILQAFASQPNTHMTVNGDKFNTTMGNNINYMVVRLKKSADDKSSKADGICSTADDKCSLAEDIFCELMVHPGKRTGEIGGTGSGPDEFSQSSDREHEMDMLTNYDMKQFYTQEKIRLISFHDVEVVGKG